MTSVERVPSAPVKRCAIGIKNNVQYLFVTIPKLVSLKHKSRAAEKSPVQSTKVELPELMLFEDDRSVDNESKVNHKCSNNYTNNTTINNNTNDAVNTGACVASPLDELFGFSPTSMPSQTPSPLPQQQQQQQHDQPCLSSPLDDLFGTNSNETQRQCYSNASQHVSNSSSNNINNETINTTTTNKTEKTSEDTPSHAPEAEEDKVERYESGKLWAHGYHVVPLIVNGNGEVCCSKDLGQYYYNSFTEIRTTYGPFDAFVECAALFGGILLDKVYMLVATEVENVAMLPFAGSITRVNETRWVVFDLPGVVPVKMSVDDKTRLEEFHNYNFEGGYYYSDMVDLRLPFPFVRAAHEAKPDFMCDWSWNLRAMFHVPECEGDVVHEHDHTNTSNTYGGGSNNLNVCRNMSSNSIVNRHINGSYLRYACSTLLRGFASERVTTLRDNSKLHLLLLGRQNILNPGPRYLGRGLNGVHGAGNDHFYEYVMWIESSPSSSSAPLSPIIYARHAILRGTVPVHWSTQLSVSLAEPPMTFSTNKTEVLDGSEVYFAQTFEMLSSLMSLDSRNKTRLQPRLRCISLLRLNAQGSEDVLARFYREAVVQSERVIKDGYPHGLLDLVHVDWLNLIKEYGIDVATSTLWETAISFLVPMQQPHHSNDLTGSTINTNNNKTKCKKKQEHDSDTTITESEESMITVGVIRQDGVIDRLTTQTRFLRINCADSLDRTNLACYFTCLQMSIAMLMTMQIPFSRFASTTCGSIPPLDANADEENKNNYSAAFAPVACAKKVIPKPFLSSWIDARDATRIPHAIVHLLAEMFVENGDCVAMLYTNSAAMHGNILRGLCKMKRTAHNAVIATQRKFENIFEDSTKFRNVELLLGRHVTVHLQSISQVFLTRPVPYRHWACALIVVGVPVDTTVADVDVALRECWDERVNKYLKQIKQPTIDSAALCVTITIQGNDRRHREQMNDKDNVINKNKDNEYDNNPCTYYDHRKKMEMKDAVMINKNIDENLDEDLFADGVNISHRSFTESLIKDNRKSEADDVAFAVAVNHLTAQQPHSNNYNTHNGNSSNNINNNNNTLSPTTVEPVVRTENIVVIELDENLCSVIDAPALLRREGYLTIKGCNCVLAQYGYPQFSENEKGKGSTMKNVGASFKRGLKNFMRSLNEAGK